MQRFNHSMKYFIAIDGDDVGPLLRDKIISNDIASASKLSTDIHEYFTLLRSQLESIGCQTVFCGGDSILAFNEEPVPDPWFSELPYGPCTVSIGISSSPEYAYLALQLAKARGKNQVVQIDRIAAETTHRHLHAKI